MNIDDLTFGQLKEIATMFPSAQSSFKSPFGKYVVVRTYASGVHAGILVQQDGRQVELSDARRLWKWQAVSGISLSDVSQHGIVPAGSIICEPVPSHGITDALEVMVASEVARITIVNAEVGSP